MSTLPTSRRLTEEKFDRGNRLKVPGRKGGQVFCATPLGKRVTAELFLKPLAEFMAGGHPTEKPPEPPVALVAELDQLDPKTRALIALGPMLDAVIGGWTGRKGRSAKMMLKKRMGELFYDRLALEKLRTSNIKADRIAAKIVLKARKQPNGRKSASKYLKSDLSAPDSVRVGHWLLRCALRMPYFILDKDGFLAIAPQSQEYIDQICEDMMRRDPVLLPHDEPPPDWIGWLAEYDDRLQAPFVRDWRPETRQAIERAFGDFEHARGINALQRVPFRIDAQVLDLVKEFAVELMGHTGKQQNDDRRLVSDDIRTANVLGDRTFWFTYNSDRRGRVYAIPHFNYGREDHVRALFKFANGLPIGPSGVASLEIHCANCEGSKDREPRPERIKWARDNREKIQRIAANPSDAFDLWKNADRPFGFVAACRELAAAWADPNFITHLPIAFDGTCNGIQHLALISGDIDSAKRANLIDSDRPQDIYTDVAKRVRRLLESDSNEWATWWCHHLDELDEKQKRKLHKKPVMTFAYNVSTFGMVEQITETCSEIFNGEKPPGKAARYLAEKIREAAWRLLPGPSKVMKYIRELAKHCAERPAPGPNGPRDDRFLQWVTPTGFPVCNRYQEPNVEIVYLVWDGVEVRQKEARHRVANGCLPEIKKTKTLNAAAPNFVHSQDAAHLIRTVNAAVNDTVSGGITDIVTVHDSFACLAPHAYRFHHLIRQELVLMYHGQQDPLLQLRDQNAGNGDLPLPPPRGDLDLLDVLNAKNCWI